MSEIMENPKQITNELIAEVLASVFPEERKEKSKITYDRNYLLEARPKSLQSPFVRKSYNCQPENQKGNRHCNFCGDLGHFKRTCSRKQNFDNSKQHIESTIKYDSDFSDLVERLGFSKLYRFSVQELVTLRTIINTLLYCHPSQKNIGSNNYRPHPF